MAASSSSWGLRAVVCIIAHSAGLHGSASSVFKRSGNWFASRKRVESRIWNPASIPSKRKKAPVASKHLPSKSIASHEDRSVCLGTRRWQGPYHDAIPPRQTPETSRSPVCRGGEKPRRRGCAFRAGRRDRAGTSLAERVDDGRADREKLVEHDGRRFGSRRACRQTGAEPTFGRMGLSFRAHPARSCGG